MAEDLKKTERIARKPRDVIELETKSFRGCPWLDQRKNDKLPSRYEELQKDLESKELGKAGEKEHKVAITEPI
ncbi:MAG: hypothetical protein H7A53_05725 [Akkermansiaceae bacterium]|nr:hypothetical protein [Akkermansiaceae bacterium]